METEREQESEPEKAPPCPGHVQDPPREEKDPDQPAKAPPGSAHGPAEGGR